MTGPLKMGGYTISGLPVEPVGHDEAASIGHITTHFLSLGGVSPMQGNLNMTDSRGNKHSIIGLKRSTTIR